KYDNSNYSSKYDLKYDDSNYDNLRSNSNHSSKYDLNSKYDNLTCNIRSGVHVYRSSFNRKNLKYIVIPKSNNIIKNIIYFITNYYPDSTGLVYTLSKREAEETATLIDKGLRDYFSNGGGTMNGSKMNSNTMSGSNRNTLNNYHQNNQSKTYALYYHAGMSKNDRATVQRMFLSNSVRVICATIAFGMGINHKNVRFVIHHSISSTMINYYQESGRAGRDGNIAICMMFYSYNDRRRLLSLNTSSKDGSKKSKTELDRVVEMCTNDKCRRNSLLGYFGETVDCTGCDICDEKIRKIKNCTMAMAIVSNNSSNNNSSNNCYDSNNVSNNEKLLNDLMIKINSAKDVKKVKLIKLIKSLVKSNRMTVNQLSKMLKGHSGNHTGTDSLKGVFKDVELKKIEEFVQCCVIKGIFREKVVKNKMGFSNRYLS
ncbi:ATP-dependent DNA helicase, helicase, partial [Pseudoloma neurophilia]